MLGTRNDVALEDQRKWPWLLSERGIASAVCLVAVVGIAALVAMLQVAKTSTAADRANLQIEAIKYGIGLLAASGAVAALLLAVRRQQLSEDSHKLALKTQAHTETDAAERRVTELYTKAVEQLGSADAAVRLGGLYALERVAQNSPSQRQTVINVLCAYLRMPYEVPTSVLRDALPIAESSSNSVGELPLLSNERPESSRDPHQELQVRLTAQRILLAHLRLPEGAKAEDVAILEANPIESFWPNISVDLTGAVLIEWQLDKGYMHEANFTHSHFIGSTSFSGTTFDGDAWFSEAVFDNNAGFTQATFNGRTGFTRAKFDDDALFVEATFGKYAGFSGATFAGQTWFVEATFRADASFQRASFGDPVWFNEASFRADVWFHSSRFKGLTVFGDVAFAGEVGFVSATFAHDVSFSGSKFSGRPKFARAVFTGDADFESATFHLRPQLSNARVTARSGRNDIWPAGWRVGEDLGGGFKALIGDEPAIPVIEVSVRKPPQPPTSNP
ncbi:pentapeptide repeat-containing protein [Micromonospora sp. NPDC051141]|uniref:pentapeptide repeat-containing protein n=1 Tax=Micromonospora sp. NPDC051141 TaxID=3364284 RepID=UPI003793A11A